ncbi:MAG TPA: EamA family transporter, partial [Devosia sp.]|nr:EamA family transporter [Devosia sp.]
MDARHDEKQRDEKGQVEGSILAGIGFTVAAILLYGIQDASAKILLRDIPAPMIVMLRFWAFGLLALFLGMRRFGFSLRALGRAFASHRVPVQLLRALLLLADLLLFATGLRTLSLGQATAITLLFPIMVTVLSIPILGERVGLFRWVCVLFGFAGALIIVRPGYGAFNVGMLWVLAATACYSVYLVLTRLVSGVDGTQTSMLYAGVIGMVASSLVGVFFWHT